MSSPTAVAGLGRFGPVRQLTSNIGSISLWKRATNFDGLSERREKDNEKSPKYENFGNIPEINTWKCPV